MTKMLLRKDVKYFCGVVFPLEKRRFASNVLKTLVRNTAVKTVWKTSNEKKEDTSGLDLINGGSKGTPSLDLIFF